MPRLEDQIFNLRFTSKQLQRACKKAEKDEKTERLKVKRAIEKGNIEGAKIYAQRLLAHGLKKAVLWAAQNAIRKKSEATNYLRLGSRLDAVVSRLDTQAKMQTVNRSMVGIVGALEKSLAGNNLEKMAQTMDTFERQFENLDVQSEFVEGAMSQQAALSTPEDDVNQLLQQVADEHGLESSLALPNAAAAPATAGATAEANPDDDFSRRLAELKGR